jgi:RNA ligase (TIGR02306 family)
MNRKLATIQKILDIKSIPGADNIEVVTILGWHVVVLKNQFKIGDLCVFFEVDSFLPLEDMFMFLDKGGARRKMLVDGQEKEGIRLRTIKLRKQISQGLAMPVTILPRSLYPVDITDFEGIDVSEYLGVIKYEPPIPANLAGVVRGPFPGFVAKTDADRIQNFPKLLEKYKDRYFYVTEKLDGASMTVFIKDGELHVSGRTLDLEETEDNSYWMAARNQKLEAKLKRHMTDVYNGRYVLQGELVGEGIQKNNLKIKGQKFFCFNVYDKEKGKFLDFIDFKDFCSRNKIETVPIIDAIYFLPKTVDELVRFATRKSLINPNSWSEGVVIKPLQEINDSEIGRLVVKVINPQYLLKNDE